MKSILTDPRLNNFEIGTKDWFAAQQRMIKAKPLIKRCYDLWYRKLMEDAESVPGKYKAAKIVELGSGSSYIKELVPDIITSDVSPGLADLVIDGRSLPFADASVRAIFLTHVFHHIPDVSLFLQEASRVLVPGGVISMVDCAHTPFGRFFFSKVHPEPYNYRAGDWSFTQVNNMLSSNQALSWIVFWRDREKFRKTIPIIGSGKMVIPSMVQLSGFRWCQFAESCPRLSCACGLLHGRSSETSGFYFCNSLAYYNKKKSGKALKFFMTELRQEDKELELEARCFHDHLFREKLHQEIIVRYTAANRAYVPHVDSQTASMMAKIVSHGLDVEAIEYVLRLKKKDNVLTKKVQILFFLVEVRSQYFDYFFNRKKARLKAAGGIVFSVTMTIYKFIKGKYLIWRYDLV